MDDHSSNDATESRASQPPPEQAQITADRLSRYVLGDEIARGAMGAIHRSYDQQLDRELAIKVLLAEHQTDVEANSRFLGEAKITGQLQHPGIVPVHEVGMLADHRPFFSMKLVDGQTLANLLNERQGTDEEQNHFLKIFEQVCQALAYAHKHRVIHRDLKPANIMVGSFGEVQVMDWGIAKLLNTASSPDSGELPRGPGQPTVSLEELEHLDSSGSSSQTVHGTLLGTPAYIAPEQARGEIDRLDERADVFSLGAILCEIITGQPPYVGVGNQIIRKAWNADLVEANQRLDKCQADATIVQLAKKCLSPDPAERPANAADVADCINRHDIQVQRRLREAELAKVEALARRDAAVRRRLLYRMIAILLGLHAVGVTVTTLLYRQKQLEQAELNTELQVQQLALEQQQSATELARQTAEASSRRRAQLLYAADMQLAPILWEREDTPLANLQRLLDGHMPQPGQPDLRGFEWHYFQSQLDSSSQVWHVPAREFKLNQKGDLVLVTEDSKIQCLDPVTGQFKSSIDLPKDLGGADLKLSPDGQWLAIIKDHEITVFECASGRTLGDLKTKFEPWAPRFADDRTLLVLGPKQQFGARVARTLVRIDLNNWTWEETPFRGDWFWAESPQFASATGQVAGVVNPLQPHQSRIAVAVTSKTKAGHPSTKLESLIEPFDGASIGAWAVSRDMQRFVAGQSLSGEAVLIDMQNPQQQLTLEHASVVSTAAFSRDSRYLATGTASGLIKLWQLSSRDGQLAVETFQTLKGHLSAISYLEFTADEQRLLSSDGLTTKAWELQALPNLENSFQNISRTSVDFAFSPDGQWYALAEVAQDRMEIRNIDSGEPRWSRPLTGPPVSSVAFSDDGRYVAFGRHASQVTVVESESGKPVLEWDGHNRRLSVTSLDFSPDGRSLGIGFGMLLAHNTSIGYPPRVLDIASGKTQLMLTEHENACSKIAYSPDGSQILTASHFGRLTRWDLATGRAERLFENPGNPALTWGNSISSFSTAPTGNTIAVGSEGGVVYLLDLQSSALRRFAGHSAAVKCVAFSHDGKTLASGGADGTVRLWHVATGREMVVFTNGLHHLFVRFSPDDSQLVAGGINQMDNGSTVRCWTVNR